jgi:suppressor of ftsI
MLPALAVLVWASSATGQIPDVAEICADRPPALGLRLSADAGDPGPRGPGTGPAMPTGRAPSDLHCIDLFSTARGGDAAGVIELGRVHSPFGLAVTPEGRTRHGLTAWIAGLPDPATLGPYTTFVAWVSPLVLDPVIKLGEVGNGENALGEVALNKYMVLITAEPSADVTERSSALVLRGRSPSSKMEAHDLLAQAPSAEQGRGGGGHTHGPMEGAWTMPPGYEGVPMLPGVMELRPRVSPYALELPDARDVPEVEPRALVELPNGGTLDLTAGFARRTIRGQDVLMLAFNGQQPGPLLKVGEGSTIFVNFTNDTPLPTSVHWHGLRLDNRYDGVPGVTQDPVEPGETFRYQLYFPDAGIYWYHPHHREDIQQELGLYGNMLVEPGRADYYSPVNREEVLMLDDLLLSDDGVVPFGDEAANYMLMGRFGNLMLVNGEPDYALTVDRGEVVRFFFTNVSNTRTLNLSFRETGESARTNVPDGTVPLPIKVVGSDVGKFEREEMVQNVVISPAERYVVEVRFDRPGSYELVNQVQGINHRMGVFLEETRTLGRVSVTERAATHDHGDHFHVLRQNDDVVADIDRYRDRFDDPADLQLVLSLDVSDLPLAVEQSMLYDWIYFNPVEWTGTMPMMNWASSGEEVAWTLTDPVSGKVNTDIDWRFRVGDVVKIQATNDRNAFHAMQHPLHIHGQRFLVLEQNGVPNPNLVWKDTVMLPSGSVTDILLELTNPGDWMVHCHIAEHLESGMKFVFTVEGA